MASRRAVATVVWREGKECPVSWITAEASGGRVRAATSLTSVASPMASTAVPPVKARGRQLRAR
ncbi:hypothetical protein [Streptomyces sp. MMG1121]|uniref:hypothetical protein n=1 Tax=Streptomyces sp. MMG1121 TaxID=1415544 RepID=UPI0006AE9E90|nr:hypothetical protein [Streptomyces sp. MMG1121]KOV68770.1 hypothetical protein ADK64_07145 [Streptomyces sp. MMG1121]